MRELILPARVENLELGIYMVKKSMDEVEYRYENGKNVVTIKKRI